MIGIKTGKVTKIIKEDHNITEVLVTINAESYKAINYEQLTGKIHIGNSVLLNTTAIDLSLGTGGYHFVISNLDSPNRDVTKGGHIMKLRYSPYQVKVFAAEEQDSPYHDIFHQFKSLSGMPVIVGTLHSMLPPIVEVLKRHNNKLRIAYIMTDGAALPIDLSNMVRILKENEYICGTITIGNAFGGDLDCVNIYNGLIAAKEIQKCDIAVVTMGPGIVGTGTKYGFTGIEQGNIIDAVNDLDGRAIAIPRISFSDKRDRHKGISHHSLTVLGKIAKTEAIVGIPYFDEQKNKMIQSQIETLGIHKKHKMKYMDSGNIISILENSPLKMSTMGRSLNEEKEYFIAAALGGRIASEILTDHQANL